MTKSNDVTNPDAPWSHIPDTKTLKGLPALVKENAREGGIYAWNGGWIRLTQVYRISEEEANDHALLYLDRFEGVDDKGMTHGGALPGSDEVKSTRNWKLED